jgi:hypothetical protein
MNRFQIFKPGLIAGCCVLLSAGALAQTDVDAIMMNKNVFCVGAMYSHSSWKDYWEGTFKRDNENLGTVSTQTYSIMGSYGITNKLNVLFNVPYVRTKASSGTLHGMRGLQDASLMIKWMPFLWHVGKKAIFSIYGIGGVSAPMTNYVADFQPLAIGMHSTNLVLRPMADLQYGKFFITGSAVYLVRSNITIDRTAYYTTEMHYTNKVNMPDVLGYNGRIGYRSNTWIAEAVVEGMNTLGGFDIRKNDMPFPSNNMDATLAGVNVKYSLPAVPGLELTAGGRYTIAGRNVGQSTMFNGGIFYIMNFNKRKKESTDQEKN